MWLGSLLGVKNVRVSIELPNTCRALEIPDSANQLSGGWCGSA
jgi:hypothetical protein